MITAKQIEESISSHMVLTYAPAARAIQQLIDRNDTAINEAYQVMRKDNVDLCEKIDNLRARNKELSCKNDGLKKENAMLRKTIDSPPPGNKTFIERLEAQNALLYDQHVLTQATCAMLTNRLREIRQVVVNTEGIDNA